MAYHPPGSHALYDGGAGGEGARDLFARQELPATTRPAGPSHFSAVRTWPLCPLSRPWPLRPLSRPWPVYPIELVARHPQHRAAGGERPWRAQMLMRLPLFLPGPVDSWLKSDDDVVFAGSCSRLRTFGDLTAPGSFLFKCCTLLVP